MRDVFQQELQDVERRLVEIAELVAVSIDRATAAFRDGQGDAADAVIDADRHIDAATHELDELAVEILARQQPVARDLRIVVSAIRMSASLERMGDLATHIARLARNRSPELVAPGSLRATFTEMGGIDRECARLVVELLRTERLDLAEDLERLDDRMDALHASVFAEVLDPGRTHEAEDAVNVTLASRYHERFADHAVSIAKKVRFLATGDWAPRDAAPSA